jgi:uncharacterized CHY-type Zn-finger protein
MRNETLEDPEIVRWTYESIDPSDLLCKVCEKTEATHSYVEVNEYCGEYIDEHVMVCKPCLDRQERQGNDDQR